MAQDERHERNGKRKPRTSKSGTSTDKGKQQCCCCRCWRAIFKCCAHDSIYGSFVGPHPVSFIGCCCKCCCSPSCAAPFALASIATKLMWFVMLIIISFLSWLMIMPYSPTLKEADISHWYPCMDHSSGVKFEVANSLTKNCEAQGGYYMVYRNFFAFNLLLLMCSCIMINVKSTKKNQERAKFHHGFWFYKYLLLFALLLTSYCAIRIYMGGIFEYIMSWLGLLAAFIFSFVEFTFLLDIVELWCEKQRKRDSEWKGCCYWTWCSLILVLDCVIIGLLCVFYIPYRWIDVYGVKANKSEKTHMYEPDPAHLGINVMGIVLALSLLLAGVVNHMKKLFKYTGMLHTSFAILYVLGLIYVGLGSSPVIQARPKIRDYIHRDERSKGNMDTQFKPEAFYHGFCSFLALVYYSFLHGPRSTTAPMSVLFNRIFFSTAKKSEVPVIPIYTPKARESLVNIRKSSKESTQEKDAESEIVNERPSRPSRGGKEASAKAKEFSETDNEPESETESMEGSDSKKSSQVENEPQMNEKDYEDYANAVKNLKVYDDEKYGVRYSWSMFYMFMMIGSLSIMSGMTALSSPWAVMWYSSSYEAMGMKLGMALFITVLYIFITTFPCPKVFSESCENPQCAGLVLSPPPPSKPEMEDPEKGEIETSQEPPKATEPKKKSVPVQRESMGYVVA